MANSALLVMDVQRAIVARTEDAGYLPRLRGALDAARTAGIPVIHVVIGFRTGQTSVVTHRAGTRTRSVRISACRRALLAPPSSSHSQSRDLPAA
jgi:nicotinamidase-related amidase